MLTTIVISLIIIACAVALAIMAMRNDEPGIAVSAIFAGIGYIIITWIVYAAIHFITKWW